MGSPRDETAFVRSNLPHPAVEPALLSRVWGRLSPRLRHSVEAGRNLHTVRAAEMSAESLPGATVRQIYQAAGTARREGEAERVRLLELAPGARLTLPLHVGLGSLWLVLKGRARVAGQALRRMEALQWPGAEDLSVTTACGALLLVREAPGIAAPRRWSARADSGSAWQRGPGGVSCRPMGPRGVPGPFLLHLAPHCRVPVHRHARDEECLMLAGEMFVEDQLLLTGDYQVALAGGVHRSIETERGALVLVHGDPEPELLGPAGL